MIHVIKGNLLEQTTGIIVHGCNMQGVMGSGIAKQIKEKYPESYDIYKNAFKYGLGGGDVVFDSMDYDDFMLAHAITQEHYGTNKRHLNYAWLVLCFNKIFNKAFALDMTVKFPMIGAGLAGGDWNIIEQLINDCDPKDAVRKELYVL